MTEFSPAVPPPPAPTPIPPAERLEFAPETFWSVSIRRTRYAVAILVSALIFCTLGWKFESPLPDMGGVSLLVWQNHSLFGALVLTVVLLVATGICTLLVHPDSPHMGLFCALLGMAGLSIRGGTFHMLVQLAQQSGTYPRTAQLLAVECAQWAILVLIAETFARLLHDRFFANTRWITRSGPDLTQELSRVRYVGLGMSTAMGVSLSVSRALRTDKMRRRVATPLAVLYSGAIAWVLLFALMQSQNKGQVLMACFFAFFLSTFCAYLAFPRVPMLALLLAVPITAAVGYLYGMNRPAIYPGQAAFFAMRALPIDYITAGVPGAILGFYSAFRWSLHSAGEEA